MDTKDPFGPCFQNPSIKNMPNGQWMFDCIFSKGCPMTRKTDRWPSFVSMFQPQPQLGPLDPPVFLCITVIFPGMVGKCHRI